MPRQRTRYRRVTYVFPEDFALCLERFKETSGLSSSELAHLIGTSPFTVSPNPPKDTDGRREDSGRGWVRELQGRWPGVLG